MGLAGATKKQRIQDDPRNLRWAQGQFPASIALSLNLQHTDDRA